MLCTARALTRLPLDAARSAAAAATHAQRLQPPCRAAATSADGSGGGGASGRQIAPPDVRELARMAHIAVTDEEVGAAVRRAWSGTIVAGRQMSAACRAAAAAACAPVPPQSCELLMCGLATCTLSPLQVADWGPKIESIVEWFGQLQEVDVEGVPPALQADVEQGALRCV